jgi:hypothetical protein
MEQKLYEAANRLPDTNLTLDTIQDTPKKNGFFSRHRRTILAVATTLALIVLCFGGYSVAAEAKTYREAVAFFQANGLSTDGLSRQEIKNVYLDITTKSFTYFKTAQVIRNSLSQEQLGGYQFPQEDPTPEDLENLWNYINFDGRFVTHTNKGEYRIEQQFDQNRNCTALVHRLDGETLLWTITIPNFPARQYTAVTDGVIVFGSNFISSSSQTKYGYVAKISLDGELLWTCRLDHDFQEEDVFAVLENADGTYAIFSRGDLEQICLSRYSADGEELNFRSTSARNLGTPIAVTHYSGGYLLLAWDGSMLAKMDLQGHITSSFSYEINGYECRITDMAEFGGQILLSGYLWPKLPEGEQTYGRHEIAAILNKIYDENYLPYDVSDGSLTALVRDHYTAVLLVCDPNEGTPETFYSVRGALGSSIRVDSQGQLIWETENITQTFYSPATSSFTIGGTSYIYRYTFAPNGAFLHKENTGQIVNFRK